MITQITYKPIREGLNAGTLAYHIGVDDNPPQEAEDLAFMDDVIGRVGDKRAHGVLDIATLELPNPTVDLLLHNSPSSLMVQMGSAQKPFDALHKVAYISVSGTSVSQCPVWGCNEYLCKPTVASVKKLLEADAAIGFAMAQPLLYLEPSQEMSREALERFFAEATHIWRVLPRATKRFALTYTKEDWATAPDTKEAPDGQ